MLSEEFTVSEQTVICAFEYALGRKSLIVSPVVRDILDGADTLSPETRQKMIKSIKEKYEVNALGHPNDRDQWVHLLKRLQDIESESQLL